MRAVITAGGFNNVFGGDLPSLLDCNKKRIGSAWKIHDVFDDTFGGTQSSWSGLACAPSTITKNSDIKLAAWDWINLDATPGVFGAEATKIWGPIEDWDTSLVTSMNHLFDADLLVGGVGSRVTSWAGADLTSWDTSNVKNMWGMFEGAIAFNGDVSAFDTSKCEKMTTVFNKASMFNGQLGKWDVSKVSRYMMLYLKATCLHPSSHTHTPPPSLGDFFRE